jgi:AcrR family transcriptional regulator
VASKRSLAARRPSVLRAVVPRAALARAARPRLLVDGTAATRSARRKGRTRERLLDAALAVFVRRGYDGATTTEMATVADLGVGTFYCYFRDKRAAFEGLAQRASRTMLDRWLDAIEAGTPVEDGVAAGLETTAAFLREDLGRARLLLEDGPSFGTHAHVRLLDEVATTLRERFRGRSGAPLRRPAARALATLVVGLGVELGRVVLGSSERDGSAVVTSTVALARAATASLRAD